MATGDERTALEARRRSGGQWFFWIAILSAANALLIFSGKDVRFVLGLGATQLAHELGGLIGLLILLLLINLLVLFGHRAVFRGDRWAFVVGMALYAVDGTLFLRVENWVGVGFHAFALAMIGRGYLAARRLSLLGG